MWWFIGEMWWLIWRCGGSLVAHPDFWSRGPGFESGISHNDPDTLERETYLWDKKERKKKKKNNNFSRIGKLAYSLRHHVGVLVWNLHCKNGTIPVVKRKINSIFVFYSGVLFPPPHIFNFITQRSCSAGDAWFEPVTSTQKSVWCLPRATTSPMQY